MHKHTIHKEIQDPFAHYARGVLLYDEKRFTFVAYRVPYQELNGKSWDSEAEFQDEYRQVVARKYAILGQH
jgi:hypothetical protein